MATLLGGDTCIFCSSNFLNKGLALGWLKLNFGKPGNDITYSTFPLLWKGGVLRGKWRLRDSKNWLLFHVCVNGSYPISYYAWSKGNCDQNKLGVQRKWWRWGGWCPCALSPLFSWPVISDPFCKQKLLWRISWLWLRWSIFTTLESGILRFGGSLERGK